MNDRIISLYNGSQAAFYQVKTNLAGPYTAQALKLHGLFQVPSDSPRASSPYSFQMTTLLTGRLRGQHRLVTVTLASNLRPPPAGFLHRMTGSQHDNATLAHTFMVRRHTSKPC